MKHLIAVASTDGNNLTFTVIHRQNEVLYGTVKTLFFNDTTDETKTKLNLRAECYQRKSHSDLYGFIEKFYTDPADYIWKVEQHQDECIRETVKKAIPDGKIVRIINI